MDFEMTVNLVDKNVNSLKQLNQYINTMYKINKEKKNKYNDFMMEAPATDTTVQVVNP